MKKFLLCLALISCVAPCSAAKATVYYQNPAPSTIYVAPDPYAQAGQTLGNIIAAAAEASRREKEAKAYEESIRLLRQNLAEGIRGSVDYLAARTNQVGINGTLEELENFCFSKGWTPQIDAYGDFINVRYQTNEGGNIYHYEYAYNLRERQCRASVALPALNVQEQAVAYYTEPTPTMTELVAGYLGLLTTGQAQTINGLAGYIVTDVAAGGIAERAGLKRNDLITKIDAYEAKNHDIEQICAYLDNRFQTGAAVKATVFRNGQYVTAELR